MVTEVNTTEHINWQECLELGNNNPELAKELLTMFIKDLSQSHPKIKRAFQNNDYKTLKDLVHKLHGACCYCGVPKLKQIVSTLEEQLKLSKTDELNKLIQALDEESAAVLKTFEYI